jgi:hypothetical protein
MAVRIVKNRISPSVGRIVANFKKLPKEAYDYWRSKTPIRTGNARRRTRLQGSKIKANYNYAVPLDNGWSKQAPQGMSKPTEDYIKKRLRRIMRK